MKLDLKLFLSHVNDAPFLLGCEEGKWGIYDKNNIVSDWPNIVIWVKAPDKKDCLPKYYLRFNLSGYSNQAPTSCPWDVANNKKLEYSKWPKGRKFVSSIFKPTWKNGDALYCPCDRVAMQGHERWKNDHPDTWWKSNDTIVKYLNYIYGILNSGDYVMS